MAWIFPYLFPLFLLPGISLLFFCHYFQLPWKWSCCFLYLLLNTSLFLAELFLPFPGGLWLLPEACLLAISVNLIFHRPFKEMLPFSALTASVLSVCQGVAQCIIFWLVTKLSPQTDFIKYLNSFQFFLVFLLFLLLLFFAVKAFPQPVSTENDTSLLLLLIPVSFISLIERTISNSVYGTITIWDRRYGLVYPVVAHMEILFLQFFAGVCLFAVLLTWKKITGAMLLKQQVHAQELYLKEICSRYEKTRAFRHDVKNHLTVIKELLHAGEFQEASAYLSHLEEATDTLSCPVHTGRRAVDALLGSKLAFASEQHMNPQYNLLLPDGGEISDMDWCILLGNALDNAIHANQLLPPKQRILKINGSQKGNLYLLSFENSCLDTKASSPIEGTGLSNIRAVAKKHDGTVRITSSGNYFRLDILLIISSHSDAHLHQID